MGGSKGASYTVMVKGRETIVAAILPLQEHLLQLSNLDLLLPPLDVGVFFCYKKQQPMETETETMVSTLKASLAQALVTFYPFAGEVVTNLVGEPELLCNNRGVDFVEAFADVELRELQLHNPDESVESLKLVPNKKDGVLCIQVTQLKCGGLVLACKFDHRIADAHSANMFLAAWAEISMSKDISVVPSFRRSLLSPRRPSPGHHDTSRFDRLYVPLSTLPPQQPPSDHAINRIYFISAADIQRMQMEASSGAHKRSKLEAFSSYMWRLIGKLGAAKREAKVCRMGIVVNGRSRLTSLPSSVMDSYFGNVLSIPYGKLEVEDLKAMELDQVADTVSEFLQGATREEHFLDLIDWVEEHRPEPAVARIYFSNLDGPEEEVSFVVSSGRGFPVTEMEFGWGKPVLGSYHFPWGGSTGYVMPMPSAREGGDWVVYVHLLKGLVEAMEAEAGDIFRPLTAEFLLLNKQE